VTTSVFVLKAAIPVSLEQITKTDADTYVYIDTAYGPYAAKASNQLVVKSDLQPPPTTTTTTTTAPCECWSLANNDSVDISISYYDCTNTLSCAVCPVSTTIFLCVAAGQGSNITVSFGTGCGGGPTPSYTWTALGTNCTTAGDC
jgi:hypothetical protein